MGTLSSIGRLRQISGVVARHGLGHYLDRRKSKNGAAAPSIDSTDASSSPPADEHAIPKSAQRFRAILEELGPTFIKFGQILSTRADLLPPGFADALRGLQDDAPAMGLAQIDETIRRGLGKSANELFAEFDEVPVASASIAQVHRAVTHEGQEVAVKVQRPGIRAAVNRDVEMLAFLAELVESIVAESGLVTPGEIVEEFEDAFLAELDFRREARAMKRFAKNFEKGGYRFVVPNVYDDLSCRSVLTMDFIRGANLARLGPQHDRREICANIINGAFEGLFVDGLFHGDPHPGNCFVLDDNRIALIDFGSVGEVSYAMRQTLLVLVLSIGLRDADTVARLLYRVGMPEGHVSLFQLRDACASLFEQYLGEGASLAEIEATELLRELFTLAARFKVRIPSEYALMGRAAMTVEGVLRGVDPDAKVLELANPYIRKLITEQFSIPEVGDSAIKNMMRAHSFMSELPLMGSQILMDLEMGKLQMQISSPKLDDISRNIDALGVTVFMGLVAGGLVTGSFFLLARFDFDIWLPLLGFGTASVLLGGALGRYLLAPRIKKISIEKLIGRRRRH